jgi:hypothetical protein
MSLLWPLRLSKLDPHLFLINTMMCTLHSISLYDIPGFNQVDGVISFCNFRLQFQLRMDASSCVEWNRNGTNLWIKISSTVGLNDTNLWIKINSTLGLDGTNLWIKISSTVGLNGTNLWIKINSTLGLDGTNLWIKISSTVGLNHIRIENRTMSSFFLLLMIFNIR